MSELRITISQLEELLDRQKDMIDETVQHFMEENNQPKGLIENIQRMIQKTSYPQDFNILKRYVK